MSLPPSVRIFVATQPIDGRKGVDSLSAIVRSALQQDPLSGHLYVFFSKRCERAGFALAEYLEGLLKGKTASPVACIPINPQFVEDNQTLWQKYRRLQAEVKAEAEAKAKAEAEAEAEAEATQQTKT